MTADLLATDAAINTAVERYGPGWGALAVLVGLGPAENSTP